MKEKKAPADPQEATPVTRNKVIHLVKEMWPAYLIEILVIILGISITLALEEWRDARKERHQEQIYLKSLLADVELDLTSLEQTSAATQKMLDQGNALLAYIRNQASSGIPFDQMEADVFSILGRPKFVSNDATFSDLKSSGNLHLINDIRLKNLIFSYYNMAENIRNDQDAEQQATISLSGAYFLKAFPMTGFGEKTDHPDSNVLNDLLKNIEFGNNVLLRVTTRKELLDFYQRADSSATQLKAALIQIID